MSRKIYFLLIMLSIILLTIVGGCTSTGGGKGYTDITPTEAADIIANTPDIIIVDVSPNYIQGHLPDAVWYNLSDGTLTNVLPELDKSNTYLVYCAFSNGSIEAVEKMVDAGFKNIYRLKGDYQGWVDAGYPIETGNPENS